MMKKKEQNTSTNDELDTPPIFKTWENIYALVAGTLFILIVLFYAFTLYFA